MKDLQGKLATVTTERDKLKGKKGATGVSVKDSREVEKLRQDLVAAQARESLLREQLVQLQDRLQRQPQASQPPMFAAPWSAPPMFAGQTPWSAPPMFASQMSFQQQQFHPTTPPQGEKSLTFSEMERLARNVFSTPC